jgi:methylmalonyl-CoA mutase N-terminal domain/subunit
MRVERGETVIVGVNKYADNNGPPVIPTPDYSTLEREQVERVRGVRTKRDGAIAAKCLLVLRSAARSYASPGESRVPLMELIIDAVRARASVGEIADGLRDEWGTYRPG